MPKRKRRLSSRTPENTKNFCSEIESGECDNYTLNFHETEIKCNEIKETIYEGLRNF